MLPRRPSLTLTDATSAWLRLPARSRVWPASAAAVAVMAVMALMSGGAWMLAIAAEGPPEPDKVAVFMRAKLGHSQDVLEGLATEDFDLIERGAQGLALASLDSNWQVLQTEDYVRQSAEFRRACGTLRDAAEAKNLDGATVAWMDVTLKCVQCHKYVRDAK